MQKQKVIGKTIAAVMMGAGLAQMSGCEVDSFMWDRSKTGRFATTPTIVPILDRIDAVEKDAPSWGATTTPTADDLIPNDLTYRLYPGDGVTVRVFELYAPGEWSIIQRRLDASGRLRVQELGDVQAAGMTPQEFADYLTELYQKVIVHPQVDVSVDQASGFRYTVSGFLQTPGVFQLNTPDLKLVDALALAGGAPITTDRIYIVRSVQLSERMRPMYEQQPVERGGTRAPTTTEPQPNIDEIIEQLPEREEPAKPGMMRQEDDRTVDIDELQGVTGTQQDPNVDVDTITPPRPTEPTAADETWVYVPERGEWVKMKGGQPVNAAAGGSEDPSRRMVVERVIEIEYERLMRGDNSLNVIVRPNDQIYVEGPPVGLWYVSGEIARPGVFNLPDRGRITLSRAIATAGDLAPLAVPDRVDLVRKVGRNQEATIRLSLAAIRKRTEPDIYLKADDHVIIGTDWLATPLAILRNGFRTTYGFGFLLDRNFGGDVFGAEPGRVN